MLLLNTGSSYITAKFYIQDHLYSPAALLWCTGQIDEMYEYDAYGQPTIYTDDGNDNQWLTDDDITADSSEKGNPYLFTGREVDILDSGSLKIQYNRFRYYEYYVGRWFTGDFLGYADGLNLYEYISSSPIMHSDSIGLKKRLTLKEKAKMALHWVDEDLNQYHFYKLSGLNNLVDKMLFPVLDKIKYSTKTHGAGASYYPKKHTMGIKIEEDDFKYKSTAYVVSIMVFHETIHAYNDISGIISGDEFEDVYLDEALAHTAQYMLEADRLRYVEDLLNKLIKEKRKIDDEVRDRLRHEWSGAWQLINRIPQSQMYLPDWLVKEIRKRIPDYPKDFVIGLKNIRMVKQYYGIEFSCSKIANDYNQWAQREKLPCIKFTCKMYKVQPFDIYLKTMSQKLHKVFE